MLTFDLTSNCYCLWYFCYLTANNNDDWISQKQKRGWTGLGWSFRVLDKMIRQFGISVPQQKATKPIIRCFNNFPLENAQNFETTNISFNFNVFSSIEYEVSSVLLLLTQWLNIICSLPVRWWWCAVLLFYAIKLYRIQVSGKVFQKL